ncbi:GNAT family N-acetyltransferase [Pedobacter rhodius]|uniref:GNAT family N-acetyltransferase n=1 Tax=Pedobacter rhodius TaxID=3004098 RepID=A0ABT4KVL1_9SPHI|nr:GNAT family N-acetyltransferase [Pedobacter sp. SJ11]MCZ4221893.1 GNAT family N-acetyltransferase [Pedobacter sp. SJ11]
MKIFIETERLILREILHSDVDSMFEMDSDRDVHLYIGNNPFTKKTESEANVEFIREQYLQNGIGRWAVIEKTSGNVIGWAGLKLITEMCNNRSGYYDIGYRFIKRYWGKGYASESSSAVINYGFNQMQLSEIIGIADTANLASVKVLERAGLKKIELFNYDGKLHHWMRIEQPLTQEYNMVY